MPMNYRTPQQLAKAELAASWLKDKYTSANRWPKNIGCHEQLCTSCNSREMNYPVEFILPINWFWIGHWIPKMNCLSIEAEVVAHLLEDRSLKDWALWDSTMMLEIFRPASSWWWRVPGSTTRTTMASPTGLLKRLLLSTKLCLASSSLWRIRINSMRWRF